MISMLNLNQVVMGTLLEMINASSEEEVSEDIIREIKIILLEEEGKALDALGREIDAGLENDGTLEAVDQEYKTKLEDIKSTFNIEMGELDKNLDELEEAQTVLVGADEAVQIQTLSASLKGS